MPNNRARSQRLSMPNTIGMISTVQCQTTGQDLINLYAKRGAIASHTVIKAESIPTNMYLDIYVMHIVMRSYIQRS